MRLTRGFAVRYIVADSRGLPSQAGWPFASLEVTPGEARTKLFRTSVAIPSSTPVEVREATFEFGKRTHRTVLRFHVVPPKSGVAIVGVDFVNRTRAQETVAALRGAGFEINAAGAGLARPRSHRRVSPLGD